MGRVSPNYYVQDGVVPRTRLPEVLRRIRELDARSGLRIGNVFHAGDGNLHPLICYDEKIAGQAEQAEAVASEILCYCIDAGGSMTGEHGIGMDKAQQMPKMFSEEDLALMQRVRAAFDPQRICNPGRYSRRRGCAGKCRVPIARIPWRRRSSESGGDRASCSDVARWLPALQVAEKRRQEQELGTGSLGVTETRGFDALAPSS